jgi:hypothetical protein
MCPYRSPSSPAVENSIELLALRNCSICSIVVSRASFMWITILAMINPHLIFTRNFFPSGSFLGGKTPLVQAHTTLDKASS